MSLLKFIKAQLGISSTPANNFTLDASAQDGTMKLSRGNAGATTQDVMVVDAAGKVTFPAGSDMLGVGQTWQAFIGGERAVNTTYTNTTDRPIIVSVALYSNANSTTYININGVQILGSTAPANGNSNVSAVVPAGATYYVATAVGIPVISSWAELR